MNAHFEDFKGWFSKLDSKGKARVIVVGAIAAVIVLNVGRGWLKGSGRQPQPQVVYQQSPPSNGDMLRQAALLQKMMAQQQRPPVIEKDSPKAPTVITKDEDVGPVVGGPEPLVSPKKLMIERLVKYPKWRGECVPQSSHDSTPAVPIELNILSCNTTGSSVKLTLRRLDSSKLIQTTWDGRILDDGRITAGKTGWTEHVHGQRHHFLRADNSFYGLSLHWSGTGRLQGGCGEVNIVFDRAIVAGEDEGPATAKETDEDAKPKGEGAKPEANESGVLAGQFQLVEMNGHRPPDNESHIFTFGDGFSWTVNGTERESGTFTILPGNDKPSKVDFDFASGKKVHGILKFTGDKLTICTTLKDGRARPNAFSMRASGGSTVMKLVRRNGNGVPGVQTVSHTP